MSTNTASCPVCKQINSYSSTNCIDCGAKLPWADAIASRGTPAPIAPPIPPPSGEFLPGPMPAPVLAASPLAGSGCLVWFLTGILCLVVVILSGPLLSAYVPSLIVLGSTIWVGIDASSIGVRKNLVQGMANISVTGWVVGCLLLWCVCFPAYIIARPAFIAAANSGQ